MMLPIVADPDAMVAMFKRSWNIMCAIYSPIEISNQQPEGTRDKKAVGREDRSFQDSRSLFHYFDIDS